MKKLDNWDLTAIYDNHAAFEQDLKQYEQLAQDYLKYKGHIMDSSDSLEAFLHFTQQLDLIGEKLGAYVSLAHSTDMTNETTLKDMQAIETIADKASVLASYVDNEIVAKEEKEVMSLLTTPFLKQYQFPIHNLFRAKAHLLSSHDEELLSKISPAIVSNDNAMSLLKDTDLKFPDIKNEQGQKVTLTISNYSLFITSKNREVRKNALLARDQTLSNYRDLFTELLYRELKSTNTFTKLRGYQSDLEATMFSNNLDQSLYYNLINSVNHHLDYLHRYQQLRKQVLKLDDYASYDMGVNLTTKEDHFYSFEEARDLVIKATSVLGSDYTKQLSHAFTDGWIDRYPYVNKVSGAYSTAVYGVHPYVFLNYQGKLEDVSTLAHELGHAMHSYYSNQNQPLPLANYTIFVAEVASTTNELLLANYILDHSDDQVLKLEVLNNLIETINGTIYRQTMFAEFEDFLHKQIEQQKPFTPDTLGDKYYELLKKYNGDDVNTLEISKDSWSRVDHFYYNYYVYKYATSMAASLAIVKHILSGDKEALANYLKFLTLGGSMYPLDELKVAGIDLTDPKVMDEALEMFNYYVTEFEQLKRGAK